MSLKCYEWINLFLGAVPPEAESHQLRPREGALPKPAPQYSEFLTVPRTHGLLFSQWGFDHIYCHQSCIVFLVEESRSVVQQGGFTGERSFNVLLTSDFGEGDSHED